MDSLFDEPFGFDRDRFIARLAKLARERVFIGCSSWKYEGWLGQIYIRSRYMARGRFSKKLFAETCLTEYAEVFPVVCGDFTFYQFPTEDFWRRLFRQAPPPFRFVFKVPEQITCRLFPEHPRYGTQAGLLNETFLDGRLLLDGFLRPLLPHRDQVAFLIFEFGAFPKGAFAAVENFLHALNPFLAGLPRDFRYSVEVRNQEFLVPQYFDCLRSHSIAHVYNAWTRMPELPDHIAVPGSRTADFLVARALLRRGRAYEDAVRMFSPYEELRDPNEDARSGLRELIGISRAERKTTFLFINNRLEGNAPGTIVAITDDLD